MARVIPHLYPVLAAGYQAGHSSLYLVLTATYWARYHGFHGFHGIYRFNGFLGMGVLKSTERTDFAGGPGGGSPSVNAGGVRRGGSSPPTWVDFFFLVTKIVAVGAMEIIPNDFWSKFHEDAEFEVKSAVASYFWAVFEHFLGQNVGQFFFLGVR